MLIIVMEDIGIDTEIIIDILTIVDHIGDIGQAGEESADIVIENVIETAGAIPSVVETDVIKKTMYGRAL